MNEFKETQRFNQWWIWLVGLAPVVIVLSQAAVIVFGEEKVNTDALVAMGFVLLIVLLSFWWMKLLRLELVINGDYIRVEFKGLIFAKRIIRWGEIETAEVVTYDPLWEYGGWGVKYGLKKGWCYNVSGDKGLLLNLKNGKKFMIGTQKPDELQVFLLSEKKG